MVDTDPFYAPESEFEQSNSNDPISGLQETPINEFQHPRIIATASQLGHVKGGGNITIAPDGTLIAPNPVAPTWDNITGKPSTFPPSDHTHTNLSQKFIVSNYITATSALVIGSLASYIGNDFSVAFSKQTSGLRIITINSSGAFSFTDIATTGECIINYLPEVDEYWACETAATTGTRIFRINRVTKTLIETITIESSTVKRSFFENANGYVYYYTGTQIVQLDIINRSKRFYLVGSCNTCTPFTHLNVNYLYIAGNLISHAIRESDLTFVKNLQTWTSSLRQSATYSDGKLFVNLDNGWYAGTLDLSNFPSSNVIATAYKGYGGGDWATAFQNYIIARSPDYQTFMLIENEETIASISNGANYVGLYTGRSIAFNPIRKELYMIVTGGGQRNIAITKLNI